MEDMQEERLEEEKFLEDANKKMTRKLAVILFAGLFTILILLVDPHRDFNLLLTSTFMQVLFFLSFFVVIYAKLGKIRSPKLFKEVVDTASIIQVFLLLFSIMNFQFLSISTVEGSSMEPSFYENDNILVSHIGDDYQRFDVVVIKMDEKVYYIKRIIGLPGDYVEIIDNQLYVNGFIQEQDFLATNSLTVCDVFGETTCSFTVLEGEYFVLGDNRQNSEDSRIFGTIDYDQIEGKVVYQFQTVLD
jgi:signal peptidase I